ncbi:hypothetical protein MNBD_GAMMA23-2217 [hydrothermal vent metagenome]|uniref:ATP synthase protein I n=1 Tax=hydrothermal vent metagenome TaxID=652676 RepID=A0A3B1AK55_9ZZZZ
MSANNALSHTVRKVVLTQVSLILIATAITTILKGNEFLWSTLYGGATVVTSTLFFGWKLMLATQSADKAHVVNTVALFKGIFLRFILVVALLALGMGWLKLSPAGILAGFIAAQLAYWVSKTSYGVTRRK